MKRVLTLLSVVAVGAIAAIPSSPAARGAEKPKVACWNKTFPNEQGTEHPQFYAAPRKCIIFKDGAIAYAFGVVRGYKLHWSWGQRKARGKGKMFISTAGLPGQDPPDEADDELWASRFLKGQLRVQGPGADVPQQVPHLHLLSASGSI